MIIAQDICKRFGGLIALDRCSVEIEAGGITGLVGPNGAGKTTLFNIIAGNLRPDSGKILFAGEDVTGFPPHRLYRRGLLRTFQIAHEFSRMTVLENLLVGAAQQRGETLLNIFFRPRSVRDQEKVLYEKAIGVLASLGLQHLALEQAGNLSGGQKKLLELGRALMSSARIILLDEIGAGVNRTTLNNIIALIKKLNKEYHCTFFLIEHDMDFVARLCDPVIVLAEGKLLAKGPIDQLRQTPAVIEAYFGRANADAGPG